MAEVKEQKQDPKDGAMRDHLEEYIANGGSSANMCHNSIEKL